MKPTASLPVSAIALLTMIKNTLRSLLVSALLAPAALFAAPFEGKINLKMTTEGKAQEMLYSVKGDKLRIDMPGIPAMGGAILDLGKKEMTMIMPEQQMYMTTSMSEGKDAPARQDDAVKVENTGQTEKILGYLATKYLASAKDSTTEIWLAEGLGVFASMPSQGGGGGLFGRKKAAASSQAWESALAGKELFPLRVITKDKKGKESFRMEATAVDKTPVPASSFAPPEGYQKLDMGAMMKGALPGFGR